MLLKTEIGRLDRTGIGSLVWGEESRGEQRGGWDILSPRSHQLANHDSLLYQGSSKHRIDGRQVCTAAVRGFAGSYEFHAHECIEYVQSFPHYRGRNWDTKVYICEFTKNTQVVHSSIDPTPYLIDCCRFCDLSRCRVGSQDNRWRGGPVA